MKNFFMLFAGSSHPQLAIEVAKRLKTKLGKILLGQFPDGETHVQIMDNVRGADVFVIQSLAHKPNEYLMELLITIDALKRASAKSIVAVIPYFGYARQDRKDKPRVPITAKLVANLLEKAGATRVLSVDLHAPQVEGFFDIPVDNLFARPSLISAASSIGLDKKSVIVAPDLGSVNMARFFAQDFHCDLAIVSKKRISPTEVLPGALIGDVKGKKVLLVDDLCSTGSTLAAAAKLCHEMGAKKIHAAVSHGLFIGNANELLEASPIDKIFVTNSVPQEKEAKREVVSIAPLLASAINCVVEAKSISSLFQS